MRKRDRTILKKIIEEAAIIAQMTEGLKESDFLKNVEKQRAIVMTLINIGELVKSLDSDFRIQHNQVPWKSIAGFRDVAAHGYFTLRMEEIWVYAIKDLPDVVGRLDELVATDKKH